MNRPDDSRRTGLRALRALGIIGALVAATPAVAHRGRQVPVVIDTDVGLDDAAALAALLQHPRLSIKALLVVEGAASAERGLELAGRLLSHFNRSDVALYRPASTGVSPGRPAPPFRPAVERALDAGLPALVGGEAPPKPLAFKAAAFGAGAGSTTKVTVLALGPLTNLAAALKAEPSLAARIERVVFRGAPTADGSWNVRFDPAAHRAVLAAGLELAYLRSSPATRKSAAWLDGIVKRAASGSLGAQLLARLTRAPGVRRHYLTQLASFTDELALAYLEQPSLFLRRPVRGEPRSRTVRPRARGPLLELMARQVLEGRQRRADVVLGAALPARALSPDLRRRRAAILARHGRSEWRAMLVMNELHQHLGAYSVIGVKMGLRAAELLNAPLSGMRIVSHSAPRPPVSCLNDGVIVATGATPGRALFHRRAGAAGSTRVRFVYNGRSLTLRLKPRYQREIAKTIGELKRAHGLSDPRYWAGVRRKALEIWQRWHRGELFDVTRP